ncbi:hypothetical protein [Streptosporangium sandarakinum]|uniref:Tryptophan-rich sensory protein n=1 Tax=Streptosporangium sandarakinum TaxID=1260955 RepID=A0A852USL1_9ACTN|nr:hypothetical protein [Streptosporangium sandarakinum]NYF40192.1 hypothetical protein [Streptosporangium sandarakinum]
MGDGMRQGAARQALTAGAVVTGLTLGATGNYGDANRSPSAIVPPSRAFGIWGPIYAGSLAYAAYQAMPRRRADHVLGRLALPAALGYLGAGLWSRARGTRAFLPLVGVTWASAMAAYALTGRDTLEERKWAEATEGPFGGGIGSWAPTGGSGSAGGAGRPGTPDAAGDGSRGDRGRRDGWRWAVREPLAGFAGWLTLASAISVLDGTVDGPAAADPQRRWAVPALAVTGAVATAVTAAGPRSISYPATLVWGLAGTAVQQRRHTATAVTAGALAAVVAGVAALRNRRRGTR